MTQEYRSRGNRPEGIRNAATRNVRRRAMHGFIKIDRASSRRRGQHAERPDDYCGLIGQNISEQILSKDYVKPGRITDDHHRGCVDVQMVKIDLRIFSRDSRNGLAPQLRSFQPIRLIDRSHSPAPLHRGFKCDARDPLDLVHGIAHRVESLRISVLGRDAARLSKVEATQELAHKQDVGAVNYFTSQRRRPRQRTI